MESDTRANLVSAAQELMMRQGYSATGINDICRKAGVSKGAFYHSFASKEDLVLRAIDSFYEQGVQALMSLEVAESAPEDRFLAFLDVLSQHAGLLWENGCLLGGLANEMAASSDALQGRVSETFSGFAAMLVPLAEPFVAAREMEGITASDLAEHLLGVVEGAIVLSRAHRAPDRIGSAIRRFAYFLRFVPRR